MVKKNKLDCLAVLVSAENMFSTLKKVISFKIPFFFEKPAGLNFKEIQILAKLAKKNKVKNMVGLNRRFYSGFKQGIDFLNKKGGIKGILIEGHERFWKIKKQTINTKVYKNWLFANSIHTIDLLRFFGGEIKTLKSFSNNSGDNKNFTISVKFKNNIIGSYISNWDSPGGWSVSLFGKGYSVIYKPLESGILYDRKFNKKNLKISSYDKKYKSGFYMQLVHFQKLISSNKLVWPSQDLKGLLKSALIIKKISR